MLVLVWPTTGLPPDADFEGTERYLSGLADDYGAEVYKFVDDGYAFIIDIEEHDTLRMILDAIPLNTKRQVKLQVMPLLPLTPIPTG